MKISVIRLILTGMVMIIVSGQSAYSQEMKVADLSNIENLLIANGNLNDLLNAYETNKKVMIDQMRIEKFENDYFLLAKDVVNHWGYIFKLISKKKKLYLNPSDDINACDCEILSINSFKIVNGEIKGCIECNHKISVKKDF